MEQRICSHECTDRDGHACIHLLENPEGGYHRRFTGAGRAYDLVCARCAAEPDQFEKKLRRICAECFTRLEEDGSWEDIVGRPEVIRREVALRFDHRQVDVPGLAGVQIAVIEPVQGIGGCWLIVSATGELFRVDVHQPRVRLLGRIPGDTMDFGVNLIARVDPRGRMLAVAEAQGLRGAVVDLASGAIVMALRREAYHQEHCTFPIAWVEWESRLLLIHATQWNRLEVSDPVTGMLLTERSIADYEQGQSQPEHYLNYFHCTLTVSPNQRYVVDHGWVWHPAGIVTAWDVGRWLHQNVWESEDGPSKVTFCQRDYYWDGPLSWIDDHHVAVWGYGADDEWLIPAVCVFDVTTGRQVRWFPGPPKGVIVCHQNYLFSWAEGEGTAAWDVVTGDELIRDAELVPVGFHAGSREFLSTEGDGRFVVSRLLRTGEVSPCELATM